MDKRFTDILQLIKQSRTNAIRAVNAELINLYWNIGEYISNKLQNSEWGDSVVSELAKFIHWRYVRFFCPPLEGDISRNCVTSVIQQTEPEIKGFSDKNIWRMKQFYETYKEFPKLAPVVREISWSHNLAIFSRCKSTEERAFYLKITKQENYSFRELDRQISASLFERTMIGNSKLSTVLRETNQDLTNTFKDSYVFEFLNLTEPHSESDLQRGLESK